MPAASSSRSIGISTTSTPRGIPATPSSRRMAAISCAAPRGRPESGEIAPWSPVLPPFECSGSSHGEYMRWFFAAEPKSQTHGSPVRVSSAQRSVLL